MKIKVQLVSTNRPIFGELSNMKIFGEASNKFGHDFLNEEQVEITT